LRHRRKTNPQKTDLQVLEVFIKITFPGITCWNYQTIQR